MQTPRLLAVLLLVSFLLQSCGSKREIAPEERGTPNTLPPELVLHREAQSVFMQWMNGFGKDDMLRQQYGLLSWKTRNVLNAAGVRDAAAFEAWFRDRQAAAESPFFFRFSRIDVLDIDMRDSARAIVTATFAAEMPGKQIESIGSFFLVRERGAWKVPFGDGVNWQRSWWQQDSKFSAMTRNDGMSRLSSQTLGVDLQYPLTWDAAEGRVFRVPGEPAPQNGVELTYLDPGSMEREAVVRIWEPAVPPFVEAIPADTTGPRFGILKKEDVSFNDGPLLTGRVYTLIDRHNGRLLKVFGAVNQSFATLTNYQSILNDIIASITPQL